MPLSFIKKLAGKLLGKPSESKTSAAKAEHARKGAHPHRHLRATAPRRQQRARLPQPADERPRGPRERSAGERAAPVRTERAEGAEGCHVATTGEMVGGMTGGWWSAG